MWRENRNLIQKRGSHVTSFLNTASISSPGTLPSVHQSEKQMVQQEELCQIQLSLMRSRPVREPGREEMQLA